MSESTPAGYALVRGRKINDYRGLSILLIWASMLGPVASITFLSQNPNESELTTKSKRKRLDHTMNMKIIPLLLALALVLAPGSASPVIHVKTIDFSGYQAGDNLSALGVGHGTTVQAFKRDYNPKRNPWQPMVPATAMIFDSSNPTGEDPDLGTPNEDFGGPGVGVAGKQGSPVENKFPRGNVVIISEDDNSSDPDDHVWGGTLLFTFDVPVDLKEVGLLDNEEGTIFTAHLASGATVQKIAGERGRQQL